MLDPPFNSDCITFKGASMSALPDVPRTVRSNSFGELKKKGKKKKKQQRNVITSLRLHDSHTRIEESKLSR